MRLVQGSMEPVTCGSWPFLWKSWLRVDSTGQIECNGYGNLVLLLPSTCNLHSIKQPGHSVRWNVRAFEFQSLWHLEIDDIPDLQSRCRSDPIGCRSDPIPSIPSGRCRSVDRYREVCFRSALHSDVFVWHQFYVLNL